MAKQTKTEFYRKQVREQRVWIEEHGGDLAGYIQRYGDPGIPRVVAKEDGSTESLPMYGDGGTKIYAADTGALARYEATLRILENRGAKTRPRVTPVCA